MKNMNENEDNDEITVHAHICENADDQMNELEDIFSVAKADRRFRPNPHSPKSKRVIVEAKEKDNGAFQKKVMVDSNLYRRATLDCVIRMEGATICIHHMLWKDEIDTLAMCLGTGREITGPLDGKFRGRPI